MHQTKRILGLAILSASLLFTGCARSEEPETTPEETESAKIGLEQLQSGCFYIEHAPDDYEQIYLDQYTFSGNEMAQTTDDKKRMIWYTSDEKDYVPVLKSNERLVYCNTSSLPIFFQWEKFEDAGYTIGFANTEVTENRVHVLNVSEDAQSFHLNKYSSASQLFQLVSENPEEEITQIYLDTIGNIPFVEEMFHEAGFIKGLNKDASYEIDAYVGSYLRNTVVKADTHCFTTMNDYYFSDSYDFIRSSVVVIDLPSGMNEGYYMLNGTGFLKYELSTENEAEEKSEEVSAPAEGMSVEETVASVEETVAE